MRSSVRVLDDRLKQTEFNALIKRTVPGSLIGLSEAVDLSEMVDEPTPDAAALAAESPKDRQSRIKWLEAARASPVNSFSGVLQYKTNTHTHKHTHTHTHTHNTHTHTHGGTGGEGGVVGGGEGGEGGGGGEGGEGEGGVGEGEGGGGDGSRPSPEPRI